ncbi:D-aminoacylase [Nonomuraea sp. NPDC050310]|uniref:N-acyl-D-amino-acid deacylase family protein n=1 Tax=Nonomuraea sp. NPDC050310 TaxID=3154935 RepID=UPI0033FA5A76
MHDLLLRGGTVHDGLGSPEVVADVAISGGRITAVTPGAAGPARRVLDVSGLIVAPGFVDPHAHSDLVPLMPDPQPFKLLQGVTTEINGNCGFSYAPHAPALAELTGERVPEWSFAGYLEAVATAGPTNHVATLVGHSTLRGAVAGFSPALTPEQHARMLELAEEAFAAGACGLSSGLIYPPGSYGGTDELVALAGVARRYGLPYTTHMRDEGARLAEALDEAIEVARRARVRLQVSHCKVGGRANHGQAGMLLGKLRAARAEGLDVLGDQYPYLAGSTVLAALLPPVALEGGALPERLASAAERARLRELTAGTGSGTGLWRDADPDKVTVITHTRPGVVGRTLAALTPAGGDPWEALCELVAADPAATMVIEMMAEPDVQEIMADPLIGIGSDNGPPTGLEHPRTWGCFPRFFGAYVRERGVVSWAEAVRKATSLTAAQFGLHGRGWLGAGAVADVCVFDPATIGHPGTYTEPSLRPTGIVHVLLEGHPVVESGEFTGERRGRVLRPRR